MKRSVFSFVGLAVLIVGIVNAHSQSQGQATSVDPSLRSFLSQVETATSGFINGDVTLWNQIASHRRDATIMGAWGGYEKGWDQVGQRYEWVAGRMAKTGAKVTVEYLSSYVSGDLAYTVAIERSEARRANEPKATSVALRVTHIFRKEDGVWKLVHRHADPLTTTVAPAAVPGK